MSHFTRSTFAFLRSLAAENDKSWMDRHRDVYRSAVREPARAFARSWAERMAPSGYRPTGTGVSPINHDRRFVPGLPYRTYVAIRLRHENALPGAPGPTMVVWIEPRRSFIAVGVHQHNGESLRRIRAAIAARPDVWMAVASLGTLDDTDMATRSPRGPEDIQDDLRRRHYTITRPLTQAEVTQADFVDRLSQTAYEMLPFARFMEAALYPG